MSAPAPLAANTTERIYCSGCGQGQTHGFYHEFWMYTGPALERRLGSVKLWTHYFCSHECFHKWEAGNGARPSDHQESPA